VEPASVSRRFGLSQLILEWTADRTRRHLPGLTAQLGRFFGRPTLLDVEQSSGLMTTDVVSCVSRVIGEVEPEVLQMIIGEFGHVRACLARREAQTTLGYPAFFSVEEQTSLLLYMLVRLTRPLVILESGVGDGRSTFIMLAAMNRNELGALHSIDICDNVGGLVEDRSRWTLHLLDPGRLSRGLRDIFAGLAPLDMFFHDSDHSYTSQKREYGLALRTLRQGGLLVSDDIEHSYAFAELVASHTGPSAVLLDHRKVSGLLRLP
jgi:predicted O-methyltransferase YrrM